MKRPALQNKQIVILRMAFRARKVIGTFEKRALVTLYQKRGLASRNVVLKFIHSIMYRFLLINFHFILR